MSCPDCGCSAGHYEFCVSRPSDCIPTCTDCGANPVFKYSHAGYCRRCNDKAGYRTDAVVTLDREKLEALLGEELYRKVCLECPDT